MKRIGLLLLAFLVFFSPCFGQDRKDSGARFSDIFGEVSVRPDSEDDDAYEFADKDMVLYSMDRIRTKSESGAILSFADLSTFVLKEESIVVLGADDEKKSNISLVAGNIWVNVKKMVTDGSLDIEMSQAVAGIKGTNITCSTSSSEDRIQVLRGHAEVLIRETREKIELSEGEELIVKAGGKTEKIEIDVTAEQKKWEDAVGRMGESIQLNEVPDILRSIMEAENTAFAQIKNSFDKLVTMEKVEAVDAAELKKNAERFIGVLLEDSLILSSIRKKIDQALASPALKADERVLLVGYLKNAAAVQTSQNNMQNEIGKIMRYQFKVSALNEELEAEIEVLRTEIVQVTGNVDAIRAAISASPSGMSQDWFLNAQQECNEALAALDELAQKVSAMLGENPSSAALQAMVKNIADQRSAIATLLKSLAVTEVDSAQITELNQIDDALSSQMVELQNEIAAYNSSELRASVSLMERRLQASIKIMSSFARIRRLYTNAQRMYTSIMKAASGSKFRTAEHEEVEGLWNNVSDRFQQLGIVANELESNIRDLESQLGTILK